MVVCHIKSVENIWWNYNNISIAGNQIEVDVDRDFAWSSLNLLIKEKLKSELSIVAWIHKGTNEITSIDLHNQNIWSNECPDILEISVQTRQDGSVEKFGFFGLTRQGIRILNKCQKPSGQSHAECAKKSLYKSYLEYVKFTEGPLEVLNLQSNVNIQVVVSSVLMCLRVILHHPWSVSEEVFWSL